MKKKRLKLLWSFLSVIVLLIAIVFFLEYTSNYKVSKTIHNEAPVITKTIIKINAPVEKVWKIFSNVNHWNEWQKEIEDPKMTGSFKVGNSFQWKSNGLNIISTLQVVDVNKTVVWSGPAFGAFAIHTWKFSEQNGITTVTVEESMEGWLVKLLQNKFQSSLDTSIKNWLGYLKSASEKK
jgi:ligand-binding SRPBCC domain-containing protein